MTANAPGSGGPKPSQSQRRKTPEIYHGRSTAVDRDNHDNHDDHDNRDERDDCDDCDGQSCLARCLACR